MRKNLGAATVLIRVLATACVMWVLVALSYPLLHSIGWKVKIGTLGEWGESFGAFNALLGVFGFSAVAYTAWLQRQTLLSTVEDQHRQRFESQYVALLKLLREVRGDVRFSHSDDYVYSAGGGIDFEGKDFHGLEAFQHAWREVRFFVLDDNLTPTEIGDIYTTRVHGRFEANLGPYFRIVYTMLHMIKSDKVLSPQEKARFGNLLRSQLTSDELVMHGLNGLSPVSKDFGSLITEFHLLKYLPDDARRRLMLRCYPAEAFEPRD